MTGYASTSTRQSFLYSSFCSFFLNSRLFWTAWSLSVQELGPLTLHMVFVSNPERAHLMCMVREWPLPSTYCQYNNKAMELYYAIQTWSGLIHKGTTKVFMGVTLQYMHSKQNRSAGQMCTTCQNYLHTVRSVGLNPQSLELLTKCATEHTPFTPCNLHISKASLWS